MNIFKNKLFFIIFFFFNKNITFYENIKIEYEYELSCVNYEDIKCKVLHENIIFIYTKLSKMWLFFDFCQSIQIAIPESEEIFYEVFYDLIKMTILLKNEKFKIQKKIIYLNHKIDIDIIDNLIKKLINHPVVKNNDIMSKCFDLLKIEFNINENF